MSAEPYKVNPWHLAGHLEIRRIATERLEHAETAEQRRRAGRDCYRALLAHVDFLRGEQP